METSVRSVPAQSPPRLIYSLSPAELRSILDEVSDASYRARQVWDWLYVHDAPGWDAMTNVPATLRHALASRFALDAAVPLTVTGEPGETRKILVGLADGERVEEVLIPAEAGDPREDGSAGSRARSTVCVSSQAGCRFHCAFCASGQAGFRRNLEAGEMVGQVILARRLWGRPVTHVVFMGIGEPLDNYEAVLKAVRILNDPDGLRIGARRITISTCGLIPGIERLSREDLQVELSVSLHAPDDALRSRLMPVNRRHPLADLLKTCAAYTASTRRIITFEYTLIDGVNDSGQQARALAGLLSGFACRVNLIPLSPVEEFAGRPSPPHAATRFAATLDKAGINTTLRRSRGCSLKAACGQLRYAHYGSQAAGEEP